MSCWDHWGNRNGDPDDVPKGGTEMIHMDPRLNSILMERRLEQRARAGPRQGNSSHFKQRVGMWLIARGQRLISRDPRVFSEAAAGREGSGPALLDLRVGKAGG